MEEELLAKLKESSIFSEYEKNHLISLYDTYRKSLDTFTTLKNHNIKISFSFRNFQHWKINSVTIVDLNTINPRPSFKTHIDNLKQSLNLIDNSLLLVKFFNSSYDFDILPSNLDTEEFLRLFCSKELLNKFLFLRLKTKLKSSDGGDKSKVSKI